MQALLQRQAKKYVRPLPELRPGYTVRVHQRVQEAGKERLQVYEGLVISVHRGRLPTDTSFTVRKVVAGVGVEKVFPLSAPIISKIDVLKVAPVRRAKLTFLRSRKGKAAKLSERFTEAEEFAVAVAKPEEVPEETPASEHPSTGAEHGTGQGSSAVPRTDAEASSAGVRGAANEASESRD